MSGARQAVPRGGDEPVVERPDTPEALASLLAGADQRGQTVLPLGADSRGRPGARPARADRLVSTAALDRVLDHEPADLTLTAGAGLPLAALDDLLAEHGQWLPLQPYRRRGTLAGLLASAADGVLALGHGRPRDLLVGARVAHADGSLARGRGRVVKNVAGYDLPRLMVGSQGTLGVVVEACLRLAPRPEASATLVARCADGGAALEAADVLLAAPLAPSFVDVVEGPDGAALLLGLDGLTPRVEGLVARATQLLAGTRSEAPTLLAGADDRALRTLLDDALTCGAVPAWTGGPPPAPDDAAGRRWVLRWSGRRRALTVARRTLGLQQPGARAVWRPGLSLGLLTLEGDAASPTAVAALLDVLRPTGPVTILAAPADATLDADAVWGPAGPDLPLMRAVKDALDPRGTLCPGRFVGGL